MSPLPIIPAKRKFSGPHQYQFESVVIGGNYDAFVFSYVNKFPIFFTSLQIPDRSEYVCVDSALFLETACVNISAKNVLVDYDSKLIETYNKLDVFVVLGTCMALDGLIMDSEISRVAKKETGLEITCLNGVSEIINTKQVYLFEPEILKNYEIEQEFVEHEVRNTFEIVGLIESKCNLFSFHEHETEHKNAIYYSHNDKHFITLLTVEKSNNIQKFVHTVYTCERFVRKLVETNGYVFKIKRPGMKVVHVDTKVEKKCVYKKTKDDNFVHLKTSWQ